MIAEKLVNWDTKYGKISLNVKRMMDTRNISISRMNRISGLKFEVVKNYYSNNIHIYNADILAKFCYVLDCAVSDLITYHPDND